jgi:nicotinate dehydrogenase subunit A
MARVSLKVNGRDYRLEVDPKTPLVYVLRNDLGLTGTKSGCGLEQCGACMVMVDGKADLHPIQAAFVAERAAQCGYCITGMIVAAKALLDADPEPSEAAVREALAGNLCRCGTYAQILKAVMRAARETGR